MFLKQKFGDKNSQKVKKVLNPKEMTQNSAKKICKFRQTDTSKLTSSWRTNVATESFAKQLLLLSSNLQNFEYFHLYCDTDYFPLTLSVGL